MTADEIQKQRRVWLDHTQRLLKKLPGVRHYAVDPPTLLALAALLSEHQAERAAHGGSFDENELVQFLGSLREHAPSLFQSRPPSEPAEVSWPKDALGRPVLNPWSKAHLNATEQGLIAKENPALAAFMKADAKHGGPTFTFLHEQEKQKAQREQLRQLEYGATEHALNPYKNNADLTRLSAFRAEHGEQVADFYKREAREPIRLPWVPDKETGRVNLTDHMRLTKTAPELAALADRSLEKARVWAGEIMSSNSAKIAELDASAREAATLLQQQKKVEGTFASKVRT